MAMATLVSAFAGLSVAPSRKSFVSSDELFSNRKFITAPRRRPLVIHGAHKKGSGSTKNGRDSIAKRLGIKIYGKARAKPGSIIVRQRGTKFHPGKNVGMGKDFTIYSLIDGVVMYEKKFPRRKQISVYPQEVKPRNPESARERRKQQFWEGRERQRYRKALLKLIYSRRYKKPAQFYPHPEFAHEVTIPKLNIIPPKRKPKPVYI